MISDKMQSLSNMTTRQKITAGIIVVVVLILLWQVIGLFGGDSAPAPRPAAGTAKPGAMKQAGPGEMQPQQMTPKPANLAQPQALTENEVMLLKLQQETQAKYIEAMNELQLLKIERDIAETNKDISSAKLAKVTSEKKIVDLLAPPPPPSFTKTIETQPPVPVPVPAPSAAATPGANYTVISVSQLQYRWSAVMGYQGRLYNVHVGDVLPADGSTVVSISKDGVTLMKDGVKKKVSMVPVI